MTDIEGKEYTYKALIYDISGKALDQMELITTNDYETTVSFRNLMINQMLSQKNYEINELKCKLDKYLVTNEELNGPISNLYRDHRIYITGDPNEDFMINEVVKTENGYEVKKLYVAILTSY